MFHSHFKALHKLDHPTNDQAPEVRFMDHVCKGGSEVEEFFHEKTACKRSIELYTPYGKFTGLEGIRDFAKGFLDRVGARNGEIHPVVQTQGSGRSVTEAEIWFDIGQEEPYKVPMSFFCDLGHEGKMEGFRLYYFYQWVEGTPAYYEPIYKPAHNEPADINRLTGVMRHYYEQLHNFHKEVQLENLLDLFGDLPRIAGYRPSEQAPLTLQTKEVLRKKYSNIVINIPTNEYIRFETITDDGRNCMVEWTSIVRKEGLAKGLVSQAGMVGYERDDQGKLCSLRICDNFKWEHEIDYTMVKPENMFVE